MAVEDIKLTLPELLDSLAPGDEVTRTTVPGTLSGRVPPEGWRVQLRPRAWLLPVSWMFLVHALQNRAVMRHRLSFAAKHESVIPKEPRD